jgi:hypothetical protein
MARRKGSHGELSATARARGTSPQALLQRRLAAEGRCARCGEKREKGRQWYCAACAATDRDWRAQWLAARREQGICRCGGDLGGNTSRCSACLKRENDARRARAR